MQSTLSKFCFRKSKCLRLKSCCDEFCLIVIKDIVDAAPTDGLWDDSRNDENQLGLSYKQLEEAMENKNSQYYKKYQEIRGPNLHKMKPIPVCEFPRD